MLEIDNDIKIIADAINTFGSCTMHILPKDKEEKLTELGYEISRKIWGECKINLLLHIRGRMGICKRVCKLWL